MRQRSLRLRWHCIKVFFSFTIVVNGHLHAQNIIGANIQVEENRGRLKYGCHGKEKNEGQLQQERNLSGTLVRISSTR